MLRRHLEKKKKKVWLWMPRFFLFLQLFDKKKKRRHQWEQKSSWLRVCGCVGSVEQVKPVRDGQKATEAHLLFKKRKNETPQSCTDPSWTDAQSEEAQLFLTRRQRPQIQQCFHHWATDVLVWYVREKWPSTSAFFFFFPQDNCWDLILMLFV